MTSKPFRLVQCATVGAAGLLPWVLAFQLRADEPSVSQLRQLSLKELLDIQVTSVARKEQRLNDTAAAITVITQEDFQRSGVVQFQDALRLVPGLEVARAGSVGWAITARGFNDLFANKLLVMVNGRSIYTPLFSGVFWDAQHLLAEDLDRIEVIRGPGASVWGANAVNGVINIITKDARDTVGGVLNVGGGNLDTFVGEFRQGWQVSDHAWLRLYGKYEDRAEGGTTTGASLEDSYQMGLGGLRYDWHPSEIGQLTLEAEGYGGAVSGIQALPQIAPPYFSAVPDHADISGAHLLSRWRTQFADESELTLQGYYDFTSRESLDFLENRQTIDLDAGYRTQLGDAHDLNVGLNYRWTQPTLPPKAITPIFPPGRNSYQLVSAYAQDDWRLIPDHLTLTAGSKFEHNSYTGLEIQPTLRLLWAPDKIQSLWASVSRAIRTPSLVEDRGRIISGVQPPGVVHPVLPAAITLQGSSAFASETVVAYELGYRVQPIQTLSFDLSLFFNEYDQLRGIQQGAPYVAPAAAPTHLVVPFTAVNDTFGNSYGTELSARWQATDWWQLRLAYTFQKLNLHGSMAQSEGFSPHHRLSLHALFDLPHDIQLNAILRAVDALTGAGVPAYCTGDCWGGSKRRLAGEQKETPLPGPSLAEAGA
jgi:iron complex outermembrane receptor protein